MTYVSFVARSPNLLIFQDKLGNKTAREGGSISWRNLNPGNIRPGSLSDNLGAIGSNSRFLVFPDENVGFEAVKIFVQSGSYRTKTVGNLFSAYAPTSDGNDPVAYSREVQEWTGLDASRRMDSLTSDELNSFADAIRRAEGWRAGKEYSVRDAYGLLVEMVETSFRPEPAISVTLETSGYIYEQSTGRMILSQDNVAELVGVGYSGSKERGGMNCPSKQCESLVGPLPRGRYTIEAPVDGPTTLSLPLTPDTNNHMCGRGNFLIHGDAYAPRTGRASEGCIILALGTRRMMAESGVTKLTVVE